MGYKLDGGRKWLMHGKERDAKEGDSNFIKFCSACSKVSVRGFKDVTPCVLIDGNGLYIPVASISYSENRSSMFF